MARPVTVPDRLNAADLQDYLDRHQIAGEIVVLDAPTPTVPAAAQAVGAGVEQIVKSILFLAGGEPVLAIAGGTQPIKRRAIAAHQGVGRKKVKIAAPEIVLATLGYPVGTVPPFGHLQSVLALMDQRLLDQSEVYAGGGENNTLMRIAPQDLAAAANAEIIDLLLPPSA